MSKITRKAGPLAFALLWMAACLNAGIIGNVPFEQMKTRAAHIVAGTVTSTVNTTNGSVWTIQTLKMYKGPAAAVITAKANRPLTASEAESLVSRRGLFMIDAAGALLPRTGSIEVIDYFVPFLKEPIPIADNELALCIDWMRGLSDPSVLIMRALAIAAASCGANRDTANAIRSQIASSPQNADVLIGLLIGLRQSEPGAISSLEQWLESNKSLHPVLLENVAWAMFSYASPDAAGSLSLRRLAQTAKDERIQGAAATVLAYIHSDETWLDMAALLTSSNKEVRHQATLGLLQAVDAGERSGASGPFERPLFTSGKAAVRTNKKRSPLPDNIRGLYTAVNHGATKTIVAQDTDAELVKFWLDYAYRNQ